MTLHARPPRLKVTVNADTETRLRALAALEDRSMAAIVRRAVNLYEESRADTDRLSA